ncbi:MDR family MFS transporter [Agarilytica rhodophyticola]|uniref:MDR family MFS transporter n=1 Tax=Agarilytica rhodophyticola TaxID=1737490 RepID=UPI000B344A7A|nr:MFS transporter [Agarilytica rhodophyticola]
MSIFTSLLKLRAEHRWMLLAAFSFNLGFYMLIPFLAGFLKEQLLLSATLVGVVLGIRSFCQQGLFIVGGLLADLFGYKLLIILGCLLRALGFALFLFSSSHVLLFSAAILTGFAGALFTPAAQAYFSGQKDISRTQMFSLVGIARNGGELLGPICGVMLLSVSFDTLCLSAAAPFAIFALIFIFLLPAESKKSTFSTSEKAADSSIKTMISGVLNNKPFIKFSVLMTGYFMLINQISFAIPIHIVNQNGAQKDVAWVLTLCALVSICLQFPVTQYCEKRHSPQYWIRVGIALMGLAFLSLIPTWSENQSLYHYISLSVLAVVFTVGTMVSFPFILSQISEFANDRSVATHYGFFYLFAGFGLIAGSSLIGIAFDLSSLNKHLAWYSLTAIGLLTAFLHMLLMPSGVKPRASHVQNSLTN